MSWDIFRAKASRSSSAAERSAPSSSAVAARLIDSGGESCREISSIHIFCWEGCGLISCEERVKWAMENDILLQKKNIVAML